MSFLSKVSKGKIKKPRLVLIYGTDGTGKSSFGAQAPKPIFLGAESGTDNLDVSRFPTPHSWTDIEKQLGELLTVDHEYKTLVIDSLDWIEPLLNQHICDRYGTKSIDLAAGGYGKGYVEAVNEWIKFNKILTRIREEKGMNIILIAHSEIIKFTDPSTQSEYDRYCLKLYKKSAALFREFCDAVLFANFEVFSKKDGSKTRAYGDGVRVIYTERRPGFDAKNRFNLPFSMPLSYEDFSNACDTATSELPETVLKSILEIVEELQDQELKQKIITESKKVENDVAKLQSYKNKLLKILEEKTT